MACPPDRGGDRHSLRFRGGRRAILRTTPAINRMVGRIVAVLAAVFAGVIVYGVVTRGTIDAPKRWAFGLSRHLRVFCVILPGGEALRHQSHVRSTCRSSGSLRA